MQRKRKIKWYPSRRLTATDIDYIRNTYKKLNSIEKTVDATGWSRNTVHKCIRDLSKRPVRTILQENKSGTIINKYNKLREAAESAGTTLSNIGHCVRHDTKTAKGYKWAYEDESNK